jgi:hypothetical protein
MNLGGIGRLMFGLSSDLAATARMWQQTERYHNLSVYADLTVSRGGR